MARWHPILPGLVALLFALLLPAPGDAQPHAETIDTAVVFVVDTSASMSRVERRIARDSHASAIASPEVVDIVMAGQHGSSAFAYVEFARMATVRIGWTLIFDAASAERFAREIDDLDRGRSPAGSTAIGAGLIAARHLFESLPWPAERLVVDVVGDGVENSGFTMDEARRRLLDMEVVINGMPMMIDPSEPELDAYYASRVIGGPGSFSVPLVDIHEMPTLLRQKIVMELF